MVLLLFTLFFILSEAFYESTNDKGISGIVEGVNRSMGALFFLMWMIGVSNPMPYDVVTPVKAILGYLFVREAIFDYFYNWVADLEWWYIGKTKWRDRFYRWLFRKVPNNFIAFIRFCFLLMGVSFLMGWSV